MKIQCDVCEKAQATVICCADEAALCAKCDVEVHAANKLASKHQRLLLECLSSKLPRCDICQERPAFIFCVEDRALFCKECDEPIHSANSRAAKHQRFLATGIRVALSSGCKDDNSTYKMDPIPPKSNVEQTAMKTPSQHISSISSPGWAVDDLLQFSDYDSPGKKDQLDLSELEWLTNNYLFNEQATPHECFGAAEVPQMRVSQTNNMASSYKQAKSYPVHKKPRYEIQDDDEDFFTVPDLG